MHGPTASDSSSKRLAVVTAAINSECLTDFMPTRDFNDEYCLSQSDHFISPVAKGKAACSAV